MARVNTPRRWIIFLAGPPVPGSSARRAQRILAEWGGRLVALGLGLGLGRIRFLDRCFPLCLAGWRLVRMPVSTESACHILGAGQRLILGGNRPRACVPDSGGSPEPGQGDSPGPATELPGSAGRDPEGADTWNDGASAR